MTHVVEGHAPIPESPRRTRLSQKDFDDVGYIEDCRGCEFLQTGIGGQQNHSDMCSLRIEAELIQTEDGQLRIGKRKDRIDHWTAKSGEAIIADQDNDEHQCTLAGEMKPEADDNNDDDANMREDNVGIETEQFDISGSPAKEPEE